MKKVMPCQQCGKEFSREYDKRRPNQFCGLVCSNKSRVKKALIDGKRWCGKCHRIMPIAEFYRKQSNYCRPCERASANNWYQLNREKALAMRKLGHIRRKYGLTQTEYEVMCAKGCTICGSKTRRLVVDHCHNTGKTRQILCNQCNIGLGHFGDSPSLLRKAAIYLD